MKGKIFIVISMLLSLTMWASTANAFFDDDWLKLQQKQLELQMRSFDQEFKQQQRELEQQLKLQQSYTNSLFIDTHLSKSMFNRPIDLMDWQRYSTASQMRINDLTRDANLRISDTKASYGFDFVMDAAMHGISWTSLADTYMGRISRITQPVLTIALRAGSAMQTFVYTAQYIGRSMQIINPLMPETRITFPDMGLKPGYNMVEGLHNLKTWAIDLATNRIHPVQFETTRVVPLDSQIDFGNTRIIKSGFLRETQVTFTPTTGMERFMLKLYPVGSYFDPMTSTTSWQRESVQTIREITVPSYQGVHRMNLNNFNANWNNFSTNWSIPQTNWSIPQMNWNIPRIDWNNILNTNWSWSIPQMKWDIPKTNWNIPKY